MPTIARIEQQAWKLLLEHGLATAPINVEALAGSLGVAVSKTSMESEVSAMLLIEGRQRQHHCE